MRHFWGNDKAEDLFRLLVGGYHDIAESHRNNISMHAQLHRWYRHARFALKPYSRTRGSITVQFHWLKTPGRQMRPDVRIDALPSYWIHAGLSDNNSWGNPEQARHTSGTLVETGDLFTIWSKGSAKPAPSWELLELDWVMRRMAAICGMATYIEDEERSTEEAQLQAEIEAEAAAYDETGEFGESDYCSGVDMGHEEEEEEDLVDLIELPIRLSG